MEDFNKDFEKKEDWGFSRCESCRDKWYKRLKRWCIVIGIIAFFFGVYVGYLMCSFYDHEPIVSASAEEIDVPDIMDGTIDDYDIENYPTANYFDISNFSRDLGSPYTEYIISNGLINSIFIITSETNNNGLLYAKQTLKELCPDIKAGYTYTLSFKTQTSKNLIYLYDFSTGFNAVWYSGKSKVISEDLLNSKVIFYGFSSEENYGTCIISEIMINKGTTAYPYTPYYKTLYNAGYTDGVLDGKEEGYTGGYGQAVKDLSTGTLATFNASSVSLLFGGASLSPGITYYVADGNLEYNFNKKPSDALILSLNYPIRNSYKLTVTVDSCTNATLFSIWFFDRELQVGYTYELFTIPVCTTTTTFDVLVDFPVSSSMQSTAFYIEPASYEDGYRQGIINNLKIEVQTQEKDFYDNGYEIGYEDGYGTGFEGGRRKGYAEGVEEASRRYDETTLTGAVTGFVFSLFDAPINSFMGSMNLEYEGFNLGDLASFIFTTLVIIGVIKLVT